MDQIARPKMLLELVSNLDHKHLNRVDLARDLHGTKLKDEFPLFSNIVTHDHA
jgi:hypothetical protein